MRKGSKADTKVWDALRRKVTDIGKWRAVVGIRDSGATTPDGKFRLVDVAFVHEFGSSDGHVPERSFMRFTFENRRGEIMSVATRLARGLLADKISIENAIKALGAFAASRVQDSIRRRLIKQDLAESTLAARAAKGDEDPTALIDTGTLINAITFGVRREA